MRAERRFELDVGADGRRAWSVKSGAVASRLIVNSSISSSTSPVGVADRDVEDREVRASAVLAPVADPAVDPRRAAGRRPPCGRRRRESRGRAPACSPRSAPSHSRSRSRAAPDGGRSRRGRRGRPRAARAGASASPSPCTTWRRTRQRGPKATCSSWPERWPFGFTPLRARWQRASIARGRAARACAAGRARDSPGRSARSPRGLRRGRRCGPRSGSPRSEASSRTRTSRRSPSGTKTGRMK